MKKWFFMKMVLAVFFLAGCAGTPKAKDGAHTKIFRQDLDNNGTKETIKVEDKFDASSNTVITVIMRDGTVAGSFTLPGRFRNMEFIDLYENEFKQMAIYCDRNDNSSDLELWGLKNNKLSKLSAFRSPCGIDADWSTIYRVRVCNPGSRGRNCSSENSAACHWDVWSWSGERFIKE